MALTYDIQFRANTDNLKGQIDKLRKDLDAAFKDQALVEGADKNIIEAARAVNILETALKKATTRNGTSLVALNASFKSMGTNVAEVARQLSSGGMKDAANGLLQTFAFADRNVLVLSKHIKEMGRVLMQSFKFSTAQTFIRFMQSALNSGLRWAEDMNRALTNIQIVTAATDETMQHTFRTIKEGAEMLGVAAKEYAEAALIFYQQGLAEDQVQSRTETTIQAARAAGASVVEMSEQLTAVWNTYRMQGDRLANAASIGAKIGAETAVDFAYIASAMQTSAVAASQLGVSYESLVAMIATVGETTLQSSSIVGTALRTIFTRLVNLKTTGEDAGDSLGRVTQSLADLGYNVLDASGNLKAVDTIINDLGTSWDTYSDKQQIAIAQTIGGTRQFSQFLAVMQNFDKYQKSMSSALEETGTSTLESQFAVWSDSIEAAGKRSQEAWAQAFASLFQQDSIKGFYDILAASGDLVGDILTGLGGVPGILTVIGAIFSTQITRGLESGLISIKEIVANSTVVNQIKSQELAYTQQLSNLYSTLTKQSTDRDAIEVAALANKLKINNQIGGVVTQLQQIERKGTPIQQQSAKMHLDVLKSRLEIYDAAVDELSAASQQKRILADQLELFKRIKVEREAIAKKAAEEAANAKRGNITRTKNERAAANRAVKDIDARIAQTEIDQQLNNQHISTLTQGTGKVEDSFESDLIKDAQQKAQEYADSVILAQQRVSEALTSMVTGFTLAAMGTSQLAAIARGDLEPSLMSILTSLTMIVPGIVKLSTGLSSVITNIADWAAKSKAAAAAMTEVAAANAATEASNAGVAASNATVAGSNVVVESTAKGAAKGLAVLHSLPIILGLTAVAIVIGVIVGALADQTKALEEAADEAAKTAKANKELNTSFTELNTELKAVNQSLKDGETDFDTYSAKIDEVKKKIEELLAENNTLEIDLVMFEMASAEQQISMLTDLVEQSNQQIIESAQKVREAYSRSGELTVSNSEISNDGSANEGLEALRNVLPKLPSNIQDQIGRNNNWNLGGIADNYEVILSNMTASEGTAFKGMMDNVETFSELWNSEINANIANTVIEFQSFSERNNGDPMGLLGYLTQLENAGKRVVDVEEELSQYYIESEEDFFTATFNKHKAPLQAQFDSASAAFTADPLGSGVAENFENAQLALNNFVMDWELIESHLNEGIDVETAIAAEAFPRELAGAYIAIQNSRWSGGSLTEELSTALEENSITLEDFIKALETYGEKADAAALQAIQLLGQKTGMNFAEVYDAAVAGEVDINKVISLIAAGRQDLIGLDEGHANRVNLSLERDSLAAIQTTIAEPPEAGNAEEESTWLSDMNANIEKFNQNAARTGAQIIPKITAEFFTLSEAAQEAYLAALENEMAIREAATAQELLTENERLYRDTVQETRALDSRYAIINGVIMETNAKNAKTATQAAWDNLQAKKETGEATEEEILLLTEYYKQVEGLQVELTSLFDETRRLETEAARAAVEGMGEQEAAAYRFAQALETVEEKGGIVQSWFDEGTGMSGISRFPTAAELAALEAAWQDLVTVIAEDIDLDPTVLEDYAHHIIDTADASDLLHDSLDDNQKLSLKIAASVLRANKGFTSLEEDLKDLRKEMNLINKGEIEISSERAQAAINKLNSSLSDILNIGTDKLSLDFITDPKTLEVAEQAMKGIEGSMWQLQQMATIDILGQILPQNEEGSSIMQAMIQLQALTGQLETITGKAWEVGQELGSIGSHDIVGDMQQQVWTIVDGLQKMGLSAAQVQEIFDGMGLELEGERTLEAGEPIPLTGTEDKIVSAGTQTQTFPWVDPATGEPHDTTIQYPLFRRYQVPWSDTEPGPQREIFTITGADGEGGYKGGPTVSNRSNAGTAGGAALFAPSSRPPTSSGGGGESKVISSPRRDNRQRYANTNAALGNVTREVEKVNAATDKAFGRSKLALMAANNNLLEKQARLYRQLAEEAENYLTADANKMTYFGDQLIGGAGGDQGVLQNMLKLGEYAGAEFAEGFIVNSELIMQQMHDREKARAIELGGVYNAITDSYDFGTEEAAEKQKEQLQILLDMNDVIREQMTLNDETAEQIKAAQEAQLELIHNWLTNKIQETQHRMELRMSINARDLELAQFLIDRLGDRASKVRLTRIADSTKYFLDDAKALTANFSRLGEIIGNIDSFDINTMSAKFSEHQDYFRDLFGPEIWQEFLDNGGAATQEMLDALSATADEMQNVIVSLYEQNDLMFEEYHNALELYIEDFERLITVYDNHADILESWSEIWRVAGSPWRNQRFQVDLLNKSLENQSSRVQGLQQEYQFLSGQMLNAQQHYEDALKVATAQGLGMDDITVQESLQKWNELKDQAAEAEADMMSEIANMMGMIEEAAQASAEVISRSFTESLSGVFADAESALDMFAQKASIDDFYVNEEDAGFKIATMLREMEAEMADVTDATLISTYNDWYDYLNSQIEKRIVMTERLGVMQEEEIWVTKEGVQLTETDLEIMQKQFELDKERAAFEDARQAKTTMRLARDASGNWNYLYSSDAADEEDKLQAIEEKINNIRGLYRDAADESSEMWLQYWVESREYYNSIDWQRYEQNEKYREEVNLRMSWYETQMNQHATQVEDYNKAIDRSFEDTTLSVIIGLQDMADANNIYKQNNRDLFEALHQNHLDYQNIAAETLGEVGISYGNLEQTIGYETDVILSDNRRTEQSIADLRVTAQNELVAIIEATHNWANQWVSDIQRVIGELRALIELTQQYTLAASGGEAARSQPNIDYSLDYMALANEQWNKDNAKAALYAGYRYDKLMDVYYGNFAKFGGDTDAIEKAKGGFIAEYGVDPESITRQEYIDEFIKSGKWIFDTGGLATGPMLAGVALNGRKELVLNAEDTENMLAAVEITRAGIAAFLNGLGGARTGVLNNISTKEITSTNAPTIYVDFPNVTAREEIEAAFENLVNQAAQYTLKPRE